MIRGSHCSGPGQCSLSVHACSAHIGSLHLNSSLFLKCSASSSPTSQRIRPHACVLAGCSSVCRSVCLSALFSVSLWLTGFLFGSMCCLCGGTCGRRPRRIISWTLAFNALIDFSSAEDVPPSPSRPPTPHRNQPLNSSVRQPIRPLVSQFVHSVVYYMARKRKDTAPPLQPPYIPLSPSASPASAPAHRSTIRAHATYMYFKRRKTIITGF